MYGLLREGLFSRGWNFQLGSHGAVTCGRSFELRDVLLAAGRYRTIASGEHTREQLRLDLPICDHENDWEIAETIDLRNIIMSCFGEEHEAGQKRARGRLLPISRPASGNRIGTATWT